LATSFSSSVEVVDQQRHVVVSVTQVAGLIAVAVDGQLERIAVTGQAQVNVVGRLEVEPSAAFETQRPGIANAYAIGTRTQVCT
jgi:hypothetical protein